MTLGKLLDWMDTTCPSAYGPEQKIAWVSDLEMVLWTEIFLQPVSLWRPYTEEDSQTRLLLPEGWRRIYTAYLGAMIDLANGEYNKYENSMSLYNGYISELGAWYADAFAPAMEPAGWMALGSFALADLTEGRDVGALPPDGAMLAVRYGLTGAGGGAIRLCVGAAGGPSQTVYITDMDETYKTTLGLALSAGIGERITLLYEGDAAPAGTASVQVLVQPPARRNSLHNGGILWR